MEVRILITKRSFRQGIVVILFSTILMLGLSNVSTANDRLWAAAGSKGHFVMIRHALAPGFGDPPEFVIGDCSTQRNLDDEGRKQALKIGRLFKSKGFKKAKIYSSQWCRCRETASMLRLGKVIDLQALNSFFEREGGQDYREIGTISQNVDSRYVVRLFRDSTFRHDMFQNNTGVHFVFPFIDRKRRVVGIESVTDAFAVISFFFLLRFVLPSLLLVFFLIALPSGLLCIALQLFVFFCSFLLFPHRLNVCSHSASILRFLLFYFFDRIQASPHCKSEFFVF